MTESIQRAGTHVHASYFVLQSSVHRKAFARFLALLSVLAVIPASTAASPETISSPEELSVRALLRSYAPDILVASSLLGWGIMADGQPLDAPFALPAGQPAARDATLAAAGTVGTILAMATTAGSAAPALLSGDVAGAVERIAAVSCVVGAAYAGRSYLKAVFYRPRPWVAAGMASGATSGATSAVTTDVPEPDHEAFDSFPSGHALLSWACAGCIAVCVAAGEARPALLGVILAEAGTVSILRVAAGEHYPGDVIAGACIGILIGASVSVLAVLR